MATNTDFIVKNGLVVTDSASFGNTITGTDAVFSGTVTASNILDSAQITNIAIATGVDSAYVISQVNALVDAAPGALDTLNELAAALGDDANFSTTITNLIAALPDSSQVASIVTSYGYSTYDSANTLGLIDSAYIAARTSAGTDSAAIINLIDSSYIQLRQANEVAAPFSLSRYDFTATSGQSSFTGLNIEPNKFEVYLNGLLLSTADYTSTSTQVDLTVAADSGDILNVIKYTGNEVIGGAVPLSQTTYEFIADSSQTVFTGADDNALTLNYVSGKIQVYINGILLRGSTDYIATNGTSVTLTLGADSGDVVQIETLTGNNIGLDSSQAQSLIDSAYIIARAGGAGGGSIDSAKTQQIIDSNFLQVSSHLIPKFDSAYDLGSPTKQWKDLYLSGNSIYLGGHVIHTNSTGIRLVDSLGAEIAITASNILDSAQITNIAIAAGVDSAYVTSQINALVDTAPGTLDTLNELAAALGDDANFSTTVTNLIATKLDSAQTTALIDSAYVQARQTASGSGLDSASVITLIDSDYITQRVDFSAASYSALELTAVTTGANTATWTFNTDDQAENFRLIFNGLIYPASSTGSILIFEDAAGYVYAPADNYNLLSQTIRLQPLEATTLLH